ncbi:MAG: YeeE/YedE family protein [Nitrospirae bacterium]|nr:YeeE/YedE family protein [Nitrospirota bacterium]
MSYMRKKEWSPIIAGLLFACLELMSFYVSSRPLGASRAYAVAGSIVEYVFFPAHAAKVPYWQAYLPYVEWTMALVFGITCGSFISSISSGTFRLRLIPEMWRSSKGGSISKRWFWAFVGGLLVGFGSRMAFGCTLGMLISGVIQLAPAGFIFMMSLWMGGVFATVVFYHLKTSTLKRG